ncbi:MAG: CDP-alcohol phosphatidyltransferase family protein [Bacteroidota bacterium]
METKDQETVFGLLFRCGPNVRLVNLVTLYRIVTAPVLLVLIFTGQMHIFKWMLLASFCSDALDGFLARRLRAATVLGAKLDSAGDIMTVIVAVIALFKTNPEFFKQEALVIVSLLVLFAIQLSLSYLKYRKPSSFHTYLAKTAAFFQGVFLLSLFFFDTTYYALYYIAVVVTTLELIEEIVLVLMLPKWKNDIKGLYWVLNKDNKETL